MLSDVNAITDAVSGILITAVLPEADIHRLIEQSFIERGIAYKHEAALGHGRRVDFLVGRTAVEIKQGAPAPRLVTQQIAGYLSSDLVDEIVVITRRKIRLPAQIGGKRVFILTLDRLWGVSLP